MWRNNTRQLVKPLKMCFEHFHTSKQWSKIFFVFDVPFELLLQSSPTEFESLLLKEEDTPNTMKWKCNCNNVCLLCKTFLNVYFFYYVISTYFSLCVCFNYNELTPHSSATKKEDHNKRHNTLKVNFQIKLVLLLLFL